ncbi:hypothetical protein SBRCBS47491_006919 [Sporothrix bragantina]|uniref:GRF-type domain-containing protein n=1 Tax=Sporothrix bragantina TaxID=671064 RepID=A0ABP0C9A4_9PEZI
MPRGGRRGGGRRSQPSTPRTSRTSGNPATPSSGRGSDGLFANGQWFCDCKPRRPAALRETRKPGANKGRWFYTCPQERRNQCTFFLWEDYAGVSSGAGGGSSHAGPPPSTQAPPRPTYRTSMGQRTTPPAERHDGPGHLTVAGQWSLPPPPPSSTGRQRQRIFNTPTAARELPGNMAYGGFEDRGEEEDEDDGFEPPPTPTPARTRRQSANVAEERVVATPTATVAAEEPPPVAEAPKNPITKYFGVVKRNSSAGESSDGSNGKGTVATDPQTPQKARTAASAVAGNNAFDYSDSEFDSDMERALVALADHSERKTRRHSDKGIEAGTLVKKDEEADDGVNMAVDDDAAAERRRRIIVPVREGDQQQDEHDPQTPSRRRNGRRLLIASDDYAAKEAAAEAAVTTSRGGAAGTVTSSSFASLFGGNDGNQQMTSFVSSVPSSQPASQAASSQAPTQRSTGTTAMTTPPSSFRSDAGVRSGASTGSVTKRKLPVDPWYGTSTQGYNGDDDNDSDDNDPFTSTPSKRVRFSQEIEEDSSPRPFMRGNEGAVTTQYPPLAGNSSTPTPKSKQKEDSSIQQQRPHWAEDEGMHVDGDREGDSEEMPVLVQSQSQSSRSSQSKDHNVTLAVLQLLNGQPVEPRVRQQIRALLNGAFEDEANN